MFEIVFFGTSAAAPSVHRGLASQAIITGENRFLIDCGEGTQRQILRSGIGFKRLNRILLTHAHLDHILGLGGLLSTFIRWEDGIQELEIFGGKPALDRVHNLLYGVVLAGEKPPIPIHLIELQAGVIMESKELTVSAFPVTHRGKGNFGFIFQEPTRRPFLAEKAEELGIPIGPERGQLVRGETITLEDDTVITPDMVLGEAIEGIKHVHIGDIARLDNIREYVEGAHALSIEATFLEVDRDVARQVGHITAKQAAELARDMNIKTLFLTHISRRYRERDVVAEARAIFPNTYVVRDLDHFVIYRDKPAEKKVTDS